MTDSAQAPLVDSGRPGAGLAKGKLGLGDVLFQGITHIGPAVAVIFTLPFIVSYAGAAAPVALIGAVIIMLFIANTVAEFSRYMPSTGGYYSFVRRGLGPRWGFLTGWSYFAYDPLGPPAVLGFLGYLAANVLQSGTGVSIPWWVFALAGILLTWVLIYRGIVISTKTAVLLGTLELLIMVALSISLLVSPGSSYDWTAPFNVSNSLQGTHGIWYGIVFSILALSGFESVAPLARETRDPRRLLPRAIFGSIALVGVFFVFAGYAGIVGWGVDQAKEFATNPNPYYVMAKRVWGLGWIFVFIAIINSTLAISIACSNAVTRVWYGMGSVGVLPKDLAKIQPRFRTPSNAVHLQIAVSVVLTLAVGLWVGRGRHLRVPRGHHHRGHRHHVRARQHLAVLLHAPRAGRALPVVAARARPAGGHAAAAARALRDVHSAAALPVRPGAVHRAGLDDHRGRRHVVDREAQVRRHDGDERGVPDHGRRVRPDDPVRPPRAPAQVSGRDLRVSVDPRYFVKEMPTVS